MLTLIITAALLILPASNTYHLPPGEIPQGWSQSGEVREFPGGALYQHINGGSEVYLEHGFETLFVQDFTSKSGDELRLEVYVMADAEGAETMIELNTRGLETDQSFGSIASVDPYQILFVTGRYYISVTGYSDAQASADGMAALARAIEEHLKQTG